MTAILEPGDSIPAREYTTITDKPVRIPTGTTHLQFRRFAGCPICHLHLRSFAARHQELTDAGITEVVFFHSAQSALQGYQALLPFAVVADPDRETYDEFGVDTRISAITHPQAWRSALRGYASVVGHRGDPANAGVGVGDGSTHLGLPADFLIAPDGSVVAAHYGRHADDQWTVDEVLDLYRVNVGKGSL